MISYDIHIDIGKLLHYSEPLKPDIDNETLLMMIRSFSSYIRSLYLAMIEESIYSPRYKGEWEPTEDEGYIEYLGTTPTTHIIRLMIDALEVREIKNTIVIRFEPYYRYPGSDHTLVQVLRAIDTGTSKFNARPILRKIVRQIESKIPSLWRGYLKKKGVA